MTANSRVADAGDSGHAMAEQPAPSAVPSDMRARLTPEQTARLEKMLVARSTVHAFDYRASTAVLGRRFYLALFAGAETRSASRLEREGLSRRLPSVLFDIAVFCLGISLMICLATGAAVVGAYIVKSALGVDLAEGPSFLHTWFYWR